MQPCNELQHQIEEERMGMKRQQKTLWSLSLLHLYIVAELPTIQLLPLQRTSAIICHIYNHVAIRSAYLRLGSEWFSQQNWQRKLVELYPGYLQSRWCGWETKHFKIRERCLGGSKQLHTSQTTKININTNTITQLISAIFRCHLYHAKLVGSSPTIVVFIQGTGSEIAWYGEAHGNGGDSIAPGVGDWAVQIEGGRRTKYLKDL